MTDTEEDGELTLGNLLKSLVLGFAKIVLIWAIVIGAATLLIMGHTKLWPCLNPTSTTPKQEDFCGKYLPMPRTAEYLKEKYPNAHTWLEFKPDGTYTLNDLPSYGHSINTPETSHGTWKFDLHEHDSAPYLGLLDEADAQSGVLMGSGPFKLKGQNAPYILHYWSDGPLEFCTSPQHSPANAAYTCIEYTEFALQGGFLLSVIAVPLLLKPGSKGSFRYPCMLGFIWAIWRMGYFDYTTDNDAPGMGYIVIAIILPLFSRFLFSFRSPRSPTSLFSPMQVERIKKNDPQSIPLPPPHPSEPNPPITPYATVKDQATSEK